MKNKKLAIVGCTIVAIILVVLTVCIIILGLIGKSSQNSINNSNNSTSTPPAANSDLATYTNTASNFQLMYSKSEWSYVENQDNVVVIFKGPKENDTDLIATNFNVNKLQLIRLLMYIRALTPKSSHFLLILQLVSII